MNWDFFISHATEDKVDVARPMAEMLRANGFKVWYDEYTLTIGDNLRRSIEHGLAESQFGIVVLSQSFFAKKWTQLELDGLFALERPGEKRILPVWHNVTAADVERFSSLMAMRLGVPTSIGIEQVVKKIVEAVRREREGADVPTSTNTLQLHPHSIELLKVASSSDGRIITFQHRGGYSVAAGGRYLSEQGNPRADALNVHCIDELVANGLIERASESLLKVTQEGFDYQIPSGVVDAPTPQFPTLTSGNFSVAKDLMQRAVASDGKVISSSHLSGHVLQVAGKAKDSGGDRRIEARWESALSELVRVGLLMRDSKAVFSVTHLGYIWTDAVNAQEVPARKE